MNDFTKIKFKIKKAKAKAWISDKFKSIKDFCHRYPVEAAALGSAIIGSTSVIIKNMTRAHNRTEEKRLKENYIYDRRHGHYTKLRRAPRQKEWSEIDRRRDNGENLNTILQDMRLL